MREITFAHLDKEEYVQHFGLPLPVLLPQHQHIQHAGSHALAHVCQACLQLRHGVHAALTVLYHLGEQERKGAQTDFSLGSGQRALKDVGFPSSETGVHFLLGSNGSQWFTCSNADVQHRELTFFVLARLWSALS